MSKPAQDPKAVKRPANRKLGMALLSMGLLFFLAIIVKTWLVGR